MTLKIPPTTLLFSVALLTALISMPPEAQGQTTVRQIASDARQAVVAIHAYWGGEEIQFGSGFFVQEDGVFVTNIHVISGAETLSVELENGEIFDNVYGLAFDARRDLAILKIPTSKVPFLEIADDRLTEVGDTVYVVGNPLGFSGTFSDGLLSAKWLEDGVSYLQISAPISEGSSGGPVLNSEGEVIGVSTLTVVEGQNLNIAVPARHASDLLSLGYTPIKFEIFAENLPQAGSISAEDRAIETVALRNSLPAEAQETLVGLDEVNEQLAIRMISFLSVFGPEGYEMTDDYKSGLLTEETVNGMLAILTSGSYSAIAVCEDDCTDLDLYVYGPNDEEIVSDVELDADPVVLFDVTRAGKYMIGAKMVSCEVIECAYSIHLFKKK